MKYQINKCTFFKTEWSRQHLSAWDLGKMKKRQKTGQEIQKMQRERNQKSLDVMSSECSSLGTATYLEGDLSSRKPASCQRAASQIQAHNVRVLQGVGKKAREHRGWRDKSCGAGNNQSENGSSTTDVAVRTFDVLCCLYYSQCLFEEASAHSSCQELWLPQIHWSCVMG